MDLGVAGSWSEAERQTRQGLGQSPERQRANPVGRPILLPALTKNQIVKASSWNLPIWPNNGNSRFKLGWLDHRLPDRYRRRIPIKLLGVELGFPEGPVASDSAAILGWIGTGGRLISEAVEGPRR